MSADLQSLGIALPSPFYLLGLVVFGLIGYAAFRRGRKISSAPLTWVGLATMLYPYVVPQTWLLWVIGLGATRWMYFHWE